jgi:AcrR family transcriptional regulator
MTAAERREQLIGIARRAFAERGFDGVSVEEIAARAAVSKPVVYEHFGGKEGLYAVVVDREVQELLGTMREALTATSQRMLLEQATFALLDYVEASSDGFRILVRDSPPGSGIGKYVSIISDTVTRVEGILGDQFAARGLRPQGGAAVCPDAGRHGEHDRPVVAGRATPAKDVVAGAPGEPGVERAGEPRAGPGAAGALRAGVGWRRVGSGRRIPKVSRNFVGRHRQRAAATPNPGSPSQ